MSLDDRVLHAPGPIHGLAICGEIMRDPWVAGPIEHIEERAVDVCVDCLHRMADLAWGSS